MRKPLKTIVYGLTHEHANGKLCALRRLREDFEVVAVVDDRADAPPYFVDTAADPSDFNVISEAEADGVTDVDVAVVETTNARLMEIAGRFAGRGVPMHCDKPCGPAMEPYRTIAGICREKGIPFQIGYMYRGNPAVKFIWDFVRRGGLGEVTFVEADMNHDYGRDGYPAYLAGFPGGILYNLGCHLVDLAYPLARGAFREAISLPGAAPGDPEGCGTAGAAVLRFEGTDVLIRASSHMPGGILCRRLRVDGTNGTFDLCPIERFDGGRLTATLTLGEPRAGRPAGVSVLDFGVQDDRFAPQLAELARIVRGETPNDQDYERDLAVHEITLKACGL